MEWTQSMMSIEVRKANDDICAPFKTNDNTVDGTNDRVQVVQDLMTWYESEVQVRL